MFSPRKLVDNKMIRIRSSAPSKGHFAVYTRDGDRFVIPLTHLKSAVFKELLKLSEEEFGTKGPITVPCDAVAMDYIMEVVKRHASTEMEEAMLISIASGCCSQSSFLHQEQTCRKLPIYGC